MMSFGNSWRVVNAVHVPETLRLLMSGTLMQEVRSKGENDNNTYLRLRLLACWKYILIDISLCIDSWIN